MLVPQAIYTDPTQQGHGYKLAASSPGLLPADLAHLKQFPRESSCLTNLQSPCTDVTTYKSFFPLPSGNYALTQQFRAGGICRGAYRTVVHSIVLSREILDYYYWNLALILDGCNFASIPQNLPIDPNTPVSIPNCNGTFAQLQHQVGQYEIHHLPDLDINCTDAIIHNHAQQLYVQLKTMLDDATQRAKFVGALQVLLRKKRIWFSHKAQYEPATYEKLMLLVWSLLPIADRQQVFWITGYDHNQIVKNAIGNQINFHLVSTDNNVGNLDIFVAWQKLPVPAVNSVPKVITDFMQPLDALENEQDLYILYTELQSYELSLLNNEQRWQRCLEFRGIKNQLLDFYNNGYKDLKDLTELLRLLKNCCFADNTADPWFNKDQVFRGVCLTALHLYAAESKTVRPIKDISNILERYAFIQLLPLTNELPQFFAEHAKAHLDTTLIAIAMVLWGPDHGTYAEITLLQKLYQIDHNMLREPLNSLRRHIQNNLIFVALGNHDLPVDVVQKIQEDHELLNWLILRHSKKEHPNDARGRALWQLAEQNDEAQGLLLDCRSQHGEPCHRKFESQYYTQRIERKPEELLPIIKDFFARKTDRPDLDIEIMYNVIFHAHERQKKLLEPLLLQPLYKKYTLQILQVKPTAQPDDIQHKVGNILFLLCVDNYLENNNPDFQANVMLLVQPYINSHLLIPNRKTALLDKLRENKEVILAAALQRIFAAIPPNPHLISKEVKMLNSSALTFQEWRNS